MLTATLETLQATLANEYGQSRGMFFELARIEALLAETYRNRVQYELLQNSDDAGATAVDVTVDHDGVLTWQNNGRDFDAADAESLCRSASSTKTYGESIGYRGIGFKSLAAVASAIDVESGGAAFSFDRDAAAQLLRARGHHVDPMDIPLIRIPTQVVSATTTRGARFRVKPRAPKPIAVIGSIDPLALLFLRHVRRLSITSDGGTDVFELARTGNQITLSWGGRVAQFAELRKDRTVVAIPLDEVALSLTTLRGRLACFLPLHDRVAAPFVISGDILTDPSRSHAIAADRGTVRVVADAAALVGEQLADPKRPWFQRSWELLTLAEDPRTHLTGKTGDAESLFLEHLARHLRDVVLPFSVAPFPMPDRDVAAIYPNGAPRVLYASNNQRQVRALRTAFGLPTMDVAETQNPVHSVLSVTTREAASRHVADLIKTLGRQPTDAERMTIAHGQHTVEQAGAAAPPLRVERQGDPSVNFPSVVAKWRSAETAAMEWLNVRGWQLVDVSKQNLGYDLVGFDADGDRAMIEIKRVERPDARFTMTNNEMGAMQVESGRYLVGVVIGDERYVRLMLLDPADKALPRERVCRAWEWAFLDWARFGTYVD